MTFFRTLIICSGLGAFVVLFVWGVTRRLRP